MDAMTGRMDAMPGEIAHDVMTQVRILYEDVIERLKIIQEGQAPKPRSADRRER